MDPASGTDRVADVGIRGRKVVTTSGRRLRGMDADITVFDPQSVIDRADYRDPEQYSGGIIHVVVNGVVTVRDGKLVAARGAGRAIRSGVAGGGTKEPRAPQRISRNRSSSGIRVFPAAGRTARRR
jgi:N-acyl-D-aspartate/D-glutamate deacylase